MLIWLLWSNCLPCTVDCNGYGNCSDGIFGNGTCICNPNFNSTVNCSNCNNNFELNNSSYCTQCLPGYYGVNCQPCAVDCNGQCNDGINGNGNCICPNLRLNPSTNCRDCYNSNYGPNCVPCNVYCNKNGACSSGINGTGLCICNTIGFDPILNCADCKKQYFGINCTLCPDCFGNGICNDRLEGDGTCSCYGIGFNTTNNCGSCKPGFFGITCSACSVNCNGNGYCDDGIEGTGGCICNSINYNPNANCLAYANNSGAIGGTLGAVGACLIIGTISFVVFKKLKVKRLEKIDKSMEIVQRTDDFLKISPIAVSTAE